MRQYKAKILKAFLLFFSLKLCAVHVAAAEDGENLLIAVKQKYDSLTPRGKFAAGCTVGFVGSRIAVNTAVSFLKFGVAAFVTAEVLHYTGVLNEIPDFSDEQVEVFTRVKNRVLRETDTYRIGIRRTLSKESIQGFFENERPAAFGLVSGALAATIL